MERVPRIELGCIAWQAIRLPLHHTRLYGGNGKSRTFTGHRMKVLHYRYATLPKLYTTDNSFVVSLLSQPFTQYTSPDGRVIRHLGYLSNASMFVLGYCAPRCFTLQGPSKNPEVA